jgi:hypothetical protein
MTQCDLINIDGFLESYKLANTRIYEQTDVTFLDFHRKKLKSHNVCFCKYETLTHYGKNIG